MRYARSSKFWGSLGQVEAGVGDLWHWVGPLRQVAILFRRCPHSLLWSQDPKLVSVAAAKWCPNPRVATNGSSWLVTYDVHGERLDLFFHYFFESTEPKLLLQFVEDLGLHYLLLEALEFWIGPASLHKVKWRRHLHSAGSQGISSWCAAASGASSQARPCL